MRRIEKAAKEARSFGVQRLNPRVLAGSASDKQRRQPQAAPGAPGAAAMKQAKELLELVVVVKSSLSGM